MSPANWCILAGLTTGLPVLAWQRQKSSREQRLAGVPAGSDERLLLPGLTAEVSGEGEVAVYLHNRHDQTIRFRSLADLLVVTLRGAGISEKTDVSVVDAFFPNPPGGQAELEAGKTAGPFRIRRPGVSQFELAYRRVERNSTVETSHRVLDVER